MTAAEDTRPDPPDVPPTPVNAGQPGLRWKGDGALRRQHASLWDERLPASTPRREGFGRQETAVLGGLVLASVTRRTFGWLIDAFFKFLLLEVVLVLGGVSNVQDPFTPSLLIAGQLLNRGYDWLFFMRGWTPGSRILGMRIVRTEDGREPGPWRGLVRVAGSMLSEAAFGIGFIWAVWHPRRQTWQDMLARTYVVMVEAAARRPR